MRNPTRANDTTVPEGADDDDFGWTLFVVHHDEHPLPPLQHTLARSMSASLARDGGSFGAALPPDARLSRRHARFLVDATGALFVVDEGSRNGVHRNGERVLHGPIAAGDVLRIGGFVLVAQPTPLRFTPSDDPRLPGPSAATGLLVEALRAHARGPERALLLRGEPGCGAEAAARVWADAAGAPLDHPDDGALWVPDAHRGPADRLTTALASGRRAVFDATAAPHDWTPPAPLAALSARHLPPLRGRREDVLATVRARWAERESSGVALSCAQAIALLLAPWPGNDAQLAAVADALAAGLDEAGLSARLAAPPPDGRADDGRVVVATDGSRFRSPAEVVDLRARPVLARILRALAASEGPLSVDDLIGAAWPGANLVGDSGAARVYAAVATLRRLGLRDALVREGEGYRLDPQRARTEPA